MVTIRCAKPFTRCSLLRYSQWHGYGDRQRRAAGVYDDLPAELRDAVEDVILNRATMALSVYWSLPRNIAAAKPRHRQRPAGGVALVGSE